MSEETNIPISTAFKKRKRAENLREITSKYDEEENSSKTSKTSQTDSINVFKKKTAKTNVEKLPTVDYRIETDQKIDRATKTADIDTEFDKDAQAMELNKEIRSKKDDGLYKGQVAYAQYYQKQDSIKGKASSNLVRQGPYRASSNIRVTTRWDYQPDLCKDYKDTGFCGFGDSCKFVHDRTDYKAGWELERDYQVKAKCGHSFCEKCALENFRKDSRCFVCKAETAGIFTHDKTHENTKENIPAESGLIINEIENASDTGESISDTPSSVE